MQAQGLCVPRRRKLDSDDLYETIHRLGFVQLDTIACVERAHHMILFSRSECYKPADLKHLAESERRLFEHWTHDASLIPMEFYPHWHHRFDKAKQSIKHPNWQKRLGPKPRQTIRQVRKHIEAHGPTMSRDFEKPDGPRKSWWGWAPTKTALEYSWRTGDFAVAGRENFHKIYDLAERIIPSDLRNVRPSREETTDWKCRQAINRLVFANAKEIKSFWETCETTEVRDWLQKEQDRSLVQVNVECADGSLRPAFASRDIEEQLETVPCAPSGLRLINPFDPVVRDRARSLYLFGFNYRIEIFVPALQRQYGYYVFPILDGDRFVGRIDLKAHRKEDRLEVKGLWWEDGIKIGEGRIGRLRKELQKVAKFSGVSEVDTPKKLNHLRYSS